jgi:hypothetical protein
MSCTQVVKMKYGLFGGSPQSLVQVGVCLHRFEAAVVLLSLSQENPVSHKN